MDEVGSNSSVLLNSGVTCLALCKALVPAVIDNSMDLPFEVEVLAYSQYFNCSIFTGCNHQWLQSAGATERGGGGGRGGVLIMYTTSYFVGENSRLAWRVLEIHHN